MAATQLTDIIIPEVYQSYTAVNSPEKTAFFESGVATRNAALDQKANSGGNKLNIPFWNDLDGSTAPNLSSDNPSSEATPNKVTTGKQIAQMAYLNQAFSAADLAGEIAGSSPMQHIRNRFGRYWMKQWQRRVIASIVGIINDNEANDGGDMVNDVSTEDGDNATADNLFSRTAFTGAAFTLGDAFDGVNAIAVHSIVYKTMVDNDDIDFIPDSQGQLTIPTFLGRRIIVDDGLPVEAGSTSGNKYTSILFGGGAIGYGEGQPSVPVEVKREALQGDGGGVEYLIERKSWLIHPAGFQVAATPAADSFSITELEAAATWDRVVERKNVPMAALITNG